MLAAGTLLPDDLYYSEPERRWIPLSDLREPQPFVASAAEPAAPEDEENGGGRRRRRRRRHGSDPGPRKPRKRSPAESALPGWIAALFAICAAAALWAWSQGLRDTLHATTQRVQELETDLKALQRQNAVLLEMSPPFTIRGVLTNEPAAGRLAVMSGVSVSAYKIEDLRKAIQRVVNLPPPATEEEFTTLVTSVQGSLPPPLNMTLSDSSGRFELSLPDPGEYAIVANGIKQARGVSERLFWAIAIESRNEPSPVLSLNEANAISRQSPALKVTPARR